MANLNNSYRMNQLGQGQAKNNFAQSGLPSMGKAQQNAHTPQQPQPQQASMPEAPINDVLVSNSLNDPMTLGSKNYSHYYANRQGQVYGTNSEDPTLQAGNQWVTFANDPSFGGVETRKHWRAFNQNESGYRKQETPEERNQRLLKEGNVSFAKEFQAGIPEMERGLVGRLGQQAAGSIYNNQQAIRESASRRGALYGGGRIAQEQAMRNQIGSGLAQAAQGVHSGLIAKSKELNDQAIQSGIDIRNQQQQIYDDAYARAMAEMQASNQAFGQLLQAGGMIAGAYFAPGISNALGFNDAAVAAASHLA